MTYLTAYNGTIEEAIVAKDLASLNPIIAMVIIAVLILIFLVKVKR